MTISENLTHILQTLASSTTLVAVSKKQPLSHIKEALQAEQRHFGENYVQELLEKWPTFRQEYPDVVLHFIGALQRNKVADVLPHIEVLHTLDRRPLAESLAAYRDKGHPLPQLLVQVNTGEEPQKAGVLPLELPAFMEYCRGTLGLEIAGVMCIPPASENPSLHFALLANYGKILWEGKSKPPHLSMGMSADYQLAIPYGATMVRIGSGLFGAREAAI
jgi:PLP dependent protein